MEIFSHVVKQLSKSQGVVTDIYYRNVQARIEDFFPIRFIILNALVAIKIGRDKQFLAAYSTCPNFLNN